MIFDISEKVKNLDFKKENKEVAVKEYIKEVKRQAIQEALS